MMRTIPFFILRDTTDEAADIPVWDALRENLVSSCDYHVFIIDYSAP